MRNRRTLRRKSDKRLVVVVVLLLALALFDHFRPLLISVYDILPSATLPALQPGGTYK